MTMMTAGNSWMFENRMAHGLQQVLAEVGKLNLLVGGEPEVLTSIRPIFDLFAANIFYCGAVSAGPTTKPQHQFVVLSSFNRLNRLNGAS